MELWVSSWSRTAGCITAQTIKDVKMERRENQRECLFVGMAWSSRSQVQGHKIRGDSSGSKESQMVQRSEPRCTLMLGERCVWFGAGLKYPIPSSCRLQE